MTPVITETQIDTTRTTGRAITAPVVQAVAALVIRDAESYSVADDLLRRIKQAIKLVDGKLDPIIEPIRAGLDRLYALKRELHQPLDTSEQSVKSKMAAWQLQERRRVEQEQRARDSIAEGLRRAEESKRLEAARLEQAAQAATQKGDSKQAATLMQQSGKAFDAMANAQQRADAVATREIQEPVRGVSSTAKFPLKWRLVDKALFVKAVAEGSIPLDMLELATVRINAQFRANRKVVEGWAGIEVYEDVQIAGR